MTVAALKSMVLRILVSVPECCDTLNPVLAECLAGEASSGPRSCRGFFCLDLNQVCFEHNREIMLSCKLAFEAMPAVQFVSSDRPPLQRSIWIVLSNCSFDLLIIQAESSLANDVCLFLLVETHKLEHKIAHDS